MVDAVDTGDYGRASVAGFGDERTCGVLRSLVESGEGLIENDQPDWSQERLGNQNLLSVALRKLLSDHVRAGLESEPAKEVDSAVSLLRQRLSPASDPSARGGGTGHRYRLGLVLGHIARAGRPANGAFCGAGEVGDDPKQRGLADPLSPLTSVTVPGSKFTLTPPRTHGPRRVKRLWMSSRTAGRPWV